MANAKLSLAIAALTGLCLLSGPAHAQDEEGGILQSIQNWWSGKPAKAIAFEATLTVADDPDDLEDKLEDASALVTESDQGASSVTNLLALARDEPARLTAALYAEGYYSGKIEVRIGEQLIDDTVREITLPQDGPAQVTITVEPGPLFHFRRIAISYRGKSAPDNGGVDDLAEKVGLSSGAPAKSSAILKATDGIIAYWKERGHAFAKIGARDVTADHAARTVDVAFTVEPGAPTQFGDVKIKGAERFETELLRSRADIPVGEPYSPRRLKEARKRLTKLNGLRGVRIIEGEAPDADGRIPILIEVTERKARYIGANAAVSSIDGAEIGAYWGHRNIFGGGENLRVEGTVSNLGGDAANGLEYEAKISLTRPSIASAYTDYKTALSFKHEEPESYRSDEAALSYGIIHQFSRALTGELAVKGSWIQIDEDAFGESEFLIVSLPGELIYDTRDNPLDAKEGWRGSLAAEPSYDLENSTSFVKSYGQISGYTEISKTPSVVAAARIGAGTIAGADQEDVPATSRFLAGGGGSVRGYAYRIVGPEIDDEIVGGLSIVEASAELRIKVSETLGVVPFVDAAYVTNDSFFSGGSATAIGVGLGLRYYTSIGPIRLDVAFPLDKLDGEPVVAFYVGLGQAF
jgi:translocation and assembly module TamA